MSGVGYADCTLTYDLLFDDNANVYCNSAAEEATARSLKDYFQRAVLSAGGQATLPGTDYAALPIGILSIAQTGVAAIDWAKTGGRPCSDAVTPPPTTGGSTNPPAGGTITPPPAAPSNAITIPSARVSGTTIKLSVQCPGAGKLSIASSAKPKKGKAVKLSTKSVTVSKSGAQSISLSLSSAAKKALKTNKTLKFTLKVTFTPNGGTAKTLTKTVTVKQPKTKSKK